MRTYNCTDIINIDNRKITLNDGTVIDFSKCREEYAKEFNISFSETKCVAEHYVLEDDRHFYFI